MAHGEASDREALRRTGRETDAASLRDGPHEQSVVASVALDLERRRRIVMSANGGVVATAAEGVQGHRVPEAGECGTHAHDVD
ncbi:hypothetical protein [Salinarimonas sp.]|uniref:hypothetical protein n=1 Tax=Salinarimonas sp. TaxID=2766526 RepID=UPI0032D909AD